MVEEEEEEDKDEDEDEEVFVTTAHCWIARPSLSY